MAKRRAEMRIRVALAAVLGVSLSLGPSASAAASTSNTAPPADDLAGFDIGFREGQTQFNRGEYLSAARTWNAAVELLEESPGNRDNRAAVYNYIADGYAKAALNGAGEDILREGLAIFDAYADLYEREYPGEDLPAQVAATREKFRAVIDALDATRQAADSEPAPAPAPDPSRDAGGTKPWKGLTISGGVALGGSLAMLVMFAGGLGGTRAAMQQFDDPANQCSVANPTGVCADIDRRAKSMDRVATIGVIAAPVLLVAGAAMLAVGLTRRSARRTIAPVFNRHMVGMVWEQRF